MLVGLYTICLLESKIYLHCMVLAREGGGGGGGTLEVGGKGVQE